MKKLSIAAVVTGIVLIVVGVLVVPSLMGGGVDRARLEGAKAEVAVLIRSAQALAAMTPEQDGAVWLKVAGDESYGTLGSVASGAATFTTSTGCVVELVINGEAITSSEPACPSSD